MKRQTTEQTPPFIFLLLSFTIAYLLLSNRTTSNSHPNYRHSSFHEAPAQSFAALQLGHPHLLLLLLLPPSPSPSPSPAGSQLRPRRTGLEAGERRLPPLRRAFGRNHRHPQRRLRQPEYPDGTVRVRAGGGTGPRAPRRSSGLSRRERPGP